MTKIQLACRVDIGVRESNDDRALIHGRILNMEGCGGETGLPAAAIVCDGCGGYAGGGAAAETVLSVLREVSAENLADPEELNAALEAARLAVMEKKEEMPHFSAMCTTVAGCVFTETHTVIFHAGDSRVYRFDGSALARMTVDHSVVQSMVDAGRITEEEALVSPQRNTITRCIGTDCLPPEIYVSACPIAPGETYLICSDGLWEYLRDERLKELLSCELPPQELADKLVAEALLAGSDDNITACICVCPGGKEKQEETAFVLD